jgi:hypothetical protein
VDLSPSSFEAYEGIRILIPGAIAVTIYGIAVATFAPSAVSPASNALAGVVAALLVGLALLFLDLPVKSAAYLNPNLPDRELRAWNIDPTPYGDYLNLYFVMLDVSFPATIRNRSLYMGAIFRIGFEGIYLVGLAALGALATAAAFPDDGPARGGTHGTQAVLVAVAATHLLTLAWAAVIRVRYKRASPSAPLGPAIREVWDEFAAEVGTAGLFAILCACYAAPPFFATRVPYVGLVSIAPLAATWAILYFRGRPDPQRSRVRRRLAPPSGVFLYSTPCVLASIEAACGSSPTSSFDTLLALAWGGLSLVPAFLISSRGHERKLNGSFKAQTTWMRMNKDALLRAYKLHPRPRIQSP